MPLAAVTGRDLELQIFGGNMLFSRIRVDRKNAAAAIMLSAAMWVATLPRAHAQAVAVADVGVHVVDPSGSAIGGAQLKMTETDKQQVHSGVTDAVGRYGFQTLPMASVRLTFQLDGFSPAVVSLGIAANGEATVPTQRLKIAARPKP